MWHLLGQLPFPFAFLLLPGRFGIMRDFVGLELATGVWYQESKWFLGQRLVRSVSFRFRLIFLAKRLIYHPYAPQSFRHVR